MLPGIRAAIVVIAAAIGLLALAFVLAATFRVAQESRTISLQADLAQRGRATPPPHRPVAIIETPAPTIVVALADYEWTPEVVEAAPVPEGSIVAALPAIEEIAPPVIAAVPAAPLDSQPPVMAFAPPDDDAPVPMPAPRPVNIGGPSPEEVAAAQAEHRIERVKSHRAAKSRKVRRARLRVRRARIAGQARESREASVAAPKSYGLFGIAPENRQ